MCEVTLCCIVSIDKTPLFYPFILFYIKYNQICAKSKMFSRHFLGIIDKNTYVVYVDITYTYIKLNVIKLLYLKNIFYFLVLWQLFFLYIICDLLFFLINYKLEEESTCYMLQYNIQEAK